MKPKLPIARLRKRRESGNVIVEFALGFFMIFWMFSAMFQLGYAFYGYNNLLIIVRNAALYASNYPYASADTTPDSTYSTKVSNMVVYGNPSPASGASPIIAGLATSNVNISMTGAAAGTNGMQPVSQVTVSIQNFSLDAVFAKIRFNGMPTATLNYTGILTPPAN